ncbi:MAG: hypothetical protein ABJB12_17750 [Pseudomonadota bacterium]
MNLGTLGYGAAAAVVLFAATARAEEVGGHRKARDVIAVDETTGAPPGFHLEQRPRYGPIIGGAAAVATGGLMLLTGFEQRANLEANSTQQAPGSGGEVFMILGGVSLLVGVPLLAYGLLSHREVYVRDSTASLRLSLSVGTQHVAGGMAFSF